MKKFLSLATVLLLLAVGRVEAAVYTADGAQDTELKAIAEGMQLDFIGTITKVVSIDSLTTVDTVNTIANTVTVKIGESIDLGRSWTLSQSTDGVDITPASPVATDYLPGRLTDGTSFYDARQIRGLATSTDKVEVEVSKSVALDRTWSLAYTGDTVKIYGDLGVPFKQDSNGQIYAITAPESGTNIKKSWSIANVGSSWTDIGSYTVTTGKSLKIYTAKATGLYAIEYKIVDATAGDEVFLATAPASPSDNAEDIRPAVKAAGTVITVYAKSSETTNSGTTSWNGFEY